MNAHQASHRAGIIAAALVVDAGTVVVVTSGCGVRCGNTVLLPDGYEGWVVILHNVTGAPPLSHDGCRVLIRVPESGRVVTSSGRAHGYGLDRYYYAGAGGKKDRLPIEADGCDDQTCVQAFQFYFDSRQTEIFFVGAKSKIRKYPRPEIEVDQRRRDWRLRPGEAQPKPSRIS